ncbi:tryptophan--tRNA ligase [Buchnera aphidicola (Mollitrichosiphum nigrofasciatum)]|uniref:tryptophan--tRNA ligase n=1 Tax=Buchnera aphidicola TaxID=9 RepID=UPI0031B8341B
MKKNELIVFSAIQPSGQLTIGNYIGVIKNWVELQKHYKCIYCIADLHALTNGKFGDCSLIYKSVLDILSILLASGIDPEENIIFLQSDVHEHTQLNWILNCYTNFTELMRMTQFKSKVNIGFKKNVGLFTYPLLMTSDILLYNSNIVPVGLDQIQHLELTRTIVQRFNKIYGPVFTKPDPFILQYGSKVMALLEPLKKMSKSDSNQQNVIFLLENIVSIVNKIKKSVTDSENPPRIIYDIQKKPGISNLLVLFSSLINKDIEYLERKFLNKSYSFFKNKLANIIVNIIYELQKKYWIYRSDKFYLQEILSQGSKKAQNIANKNLCKLYRAIGFKK